MFGIAFAQNSTKIASPEAAAVKYKIEVTTTINGSREAAKVTIFQSGKKMAEADTAKKQPVLFRLDGGNNYRIEALFEKVKNSGSVKIKELSKDLKIKVNLEYYNVKVQSLYGNKADRAAAAEIRVYNRKDQARRLETKHTDGYEPVTFFLEAHKAYVFLISYDNKASANPNGRVVYDLNADSNILFNY
ncbi:MAG: hypothetical protein WC624_02655 [Candidatus Margulisiibacteriota bacterium]